MKRSVIVALALLLWAVSLTAMPAYPYPIQYTQPNGTTIMIRLHGDEFGHWITDSQGRVLEKDADGFLKPSGATPAMMARRAAENRAARMQGLRAPARGQNQGQRRFLVILVEFSDVSFKVSNPNQSFTVMMNKQGYSVNGATGSARDYYYEVSHHQFEPVFDVFGPVKLSQPMKYYGANTSNGDDKAPEEAVIEGCTLLKDQIDFSLYDNDGDGEVDLVYMYYAGYGEADTGKTNTIWPHQWELDSAGKSFSDDGKKVNSYACSNEIKYDGSLVGIGVSCHEFGHAIGLPDFYDTDYETNGFCASLYNYSLMDSGGYNNDTRTPPYLNIEELCMLGWADESAIKEMPASGSVTLPPVSDYVAYKTPTDTNGEYFLYECRHTAGFDAYILSGGLIVYHVDKSNHKVNLAGGGQLTARTLWEYWQNYNYINGNGNHPCFYIVPAAGQNNLRFGYKYYESYGQYFFDDSYSGQIPFPGKKSINTYQAMSWDGELSRYVLSNIKYSGGVVTFDVKHAAATSNLDFCTIANPGKGVYAAGETFRLEIEESVARPVESVSWSFDGAAVQAESVVLTAGKHTVEAELLLKNGKKNVLTLELSVR